MNMPGEYNSYKFGNDVYGQQGGYNQNDYDVGPRFNGQSISQYDSPVDLTRAFDRAHHGLPEEKIICNAFYKQDFVNE